jgi:hypothetical protein
MPRELDTDPEVWWPYLTALEWQLVYGFSMAASAAGLMREASSTESLNHQMIWALVHLQEEGHYKFHGIYARGDGALIAKSEEPLEPGNLISLGHCRRAAQGLGGPPDYSVHLRAAVSVARERDIRGGVVEVLETALEELIEVERKLKEDRGRSLPEEAQEALKESLEKRREVMSGMAPPVEDVN